MPVYICHAPSGLLGTESKSGLAKALTTIHHEVTGADRLFVQVLFREIEAGDCFIAGRPLSAAHCFVHGHIRAGRSAVERGALIKRMLPAIGDILGLPGNAIWIYLSELPARAMAEFGHILPEPGDEAAWLAALPDEDRRRLEALEAEPESPR